MKQNLRIIFMGTPDFAVPSLQQLIQTGFQIVAVVTAPDKPQGRGKKTGTSPVKDFAQSMELPILQPTNLKDPAFLEELRSYQADLQFIVAFRMLPEVVWNMPRLGSYNLHASLLPQYRGAAPINWAIINGETETGVTTFQLQHEIDTGNILLQDKEPIRAEDTVGTLYHRMMHKGAALVVKSVEAISSGHYQLQPQVLPTDLKTAPKIFRETCEINWNQPASSVRNFIRGLSPYPAAWTTLHGKTLKIFAAEVSTQKASKPSGVVESDGKTFIAFQAADFQLRVTELQLEGKRRMETGEFLRGYNWP